MHTFLIQSKDSLAITSRISGKADRELHRPCHVLVRYVKQQWRWVWDFRWRAEQSWLSRSSGWSTLVPPHKRQKLDVPYRVQRQQQHEKNVDDLKKAHLNIVKLLASWKTKFMAGRNGLQIWQTQAIECYLWLKVMNGQSTQEASECAAESQGFTLKWGGCQVCSWVKLWIKERELPRSARGRYAKVSSLLELQAYLQSNKWALNPGKLADFSKNKLIPSAADQYLCKIICDDMPQGPQGLKRYMEYKSSSWIHLKVRKGISLSTACWWMHKEGFQYILYAKGLYYDGHDHPDVIKYWQKHFLPMMKKHEECMVKYVVMTLNNYQIVACTHVWYWANYQLSTAVYWVLGSIWALPECHLLVVLSKRFESKVQW